MAYGMPTCSRVRKCFSEAGLCRKIGAEKESDFFFFPKLEKPEPEKKQFHTPNRSIQTPSFVERSDIAFGGRGCQPRFEDESGRMLDLLTLPMYLEVFGSLSLFLSLSLILSVAPNREWRDYSCDTGVKRHTFLRAA